MITDSNSEFGLTVIDKKNSYTFSKHANKKTYNYKMLTNGKDSKVRTKAYTEEKIKKIFDYSEDEFYSIVFVDSRRTAKLQLGSPTQRIEFFTNLFRLNDYDSVRKIFNSKLAEARKSSTILKEVNFQITDLESEIKDLDLKTLKVKQTKLNDTNKNLVKKYDALHNKKSDLISAKSNKDNFKEYKTLVKDLDLVKSIDKQKSELENAIKDLERKRKLVKAWDFYNTAIENYNKKYSKYITEFESYEIKLFNSSEVEELEKSLNKTYISYKRELDEAERVLLKSEGAKEPKFDNTELLKLRKLKLPNYKILEKELSTVESKLDIYIDTVEALSSLEGDECPTCKQEIDKKACHKLLDTYKSKRDKALKLKLRIKENLSKATKLEDLEQSNDVYSFAFEEYTKIVKAVKKAKEEIKSLKPKVNNYENVTSILNKIKDLEKPKKPTESLKGKIKESTYKDNVKCLALLNIIYPIYDKLKNIDFKSLDKNIKKLHSKTKDLSKDLDETSNKLSKITSKIELLESTSDKLKKLNIRKEKLNSIVEEVPIIEAIIEAYSNKGIKLLIIKHIAAMIEKNINKYAPLLYSEPTKFKFEVKDDRNFDIKLCRTINGKNSEMDIRTLSGAEGRAFSFLLPLAILPLIPHERRLNIMVLDEPMQNMSDARKELFVESFIPKLNAIVPHLIILSTDNENYPNANVYTVTKEKGVSTVIKN